MDREQAVSMIKKNKLIAIIRGVAGEGALPLARALHLGGVRALEFTFDHNIPGYVEDTCEKVLAVKRAFGGELLVGCGTVLSATEADAAAQAGAQMIISPHTDAELIARGKALGAVCIPGAFTPTEIVKAHAAGADFVKLFPAGELGLGYIKAVRAPLCHIPLLAVGGVKPENISGFLDAGMTGFGVGGQLADASAVRKGDFQLITLRAQAFVNAIRDWEERA